MKRLTLTALLAMIMVVGFVFVAQADEIYFECDDVDCAHDYIFGSTDCDFHLSLNDIPEDILEYLLNGYTLTDEMLQSLAGISPLNAHGPPNCCGLTRIVAYSVLQTNVRESRTTHSDGRVSIMRVVEARFRDVYREEWQCTGGVLRNHTHYTPWEIVDITIEWL
ncbi:MAG: hypothetical protein FWE33_03495 [Defluviitaleaceae bacterium]|nr:hypothetical protein [Defluviitaleaceae bacterium]